MHRALRSAVIGVHIGTVSASVFILLAITALATSRQSRSTNSAPPSGLVVVIENRPQETLNLQALKNPSISGVALQIRWRDIEPIKGQTDWSKLDQLFAAAEWSNKWVQLLIFPGFFSPTWALDGAKTEMFSLQYGPGKGTVERLPMPWDPVYLGHWFDFVKQLSARYGKSSAFRVVAAAGPTSVSAEFTLPSKPEEIKTWRTLGYTPQKYKAAWQKTFQVYAAEFPNQYVSLSMGFGLNIDDRGKITPGARKQTRQEIIDEAMGILGRRFVLQFSNLDGFPGQGPGPRAVPFVIGYNGRVVTGFQLRTSCERNSGEMGAEENPALALRKSIDIGMQRNSAGRHVNYLEIYEPDVLADDLQPVLRYGASLFAQ
jgi:hypothetical protein